MRNNWEDKISYKERNNMVNTKEVSLESINLYDILPLLKINKTSNKEKKVLLEEFDILLKNINDFDALLEKISDNGELFNNIIDMLFKNRGNMKTILDKLKDKRLEFFNKFNYLPDSMLKTINYEGTYYRHYRYSKKEQGDFLTKLDKSSKISGQDVKDITDKFGFILIPFECLNKKCYENESYSTQSDIKKFSELKNNGYDVYVITPIIYYSLENHVYNNVDEKPIYSGKHFNTFTSVTINIPMFRSVLNTIANVGDRVTSLEKENAGIKNSLTQMGNMLEQLQRQVDIQQAQIVKQNLAIQNQAEELARFKEETLRIIDPMMIAFKKGTDVTDLSFNDTICYVGPCWGPDFDINVSSALGLKVIAKQRKMLSEKTKTLWN